MPVGTEDIAEVLVDDVTRGPHDPRIAVVVRDRRSTHKKR